MVGKIRTGIFMPCNIGMYLTLKGKKIKLRLSLENVEKDHNCECYSSSKRLITKLIRRQNSDLLLQIYPLSKHITHHN